MIEPTIYIFRGYIRSYDSHSLKQIYDVNTLNLIEVARSYGFEAPPFVDLPVSHKAKIVPSLKKRPMGKSYRFVPANGKKFKKN